MKRLTSLLLAVGLFAGAPVAAQDRPVVVELFTSQGCSACPPADHVLKELSERDDVIALALHVDYWDYIGWKDPFGDPVHAQRQRAYAAAAGRTSIYTPEMVVNGTTDVVGTKPMALSRAIEQHRRDPVTVKLDLVRAAGVVHIHVEPLAGAAGPYTVHMLRYRPLATTEVKRGENAGHTIENYNIVKDWQVLGHWGGKKAFDTNAKLAGDLPVVVLVQQGETGPIAAAARLR
tara:strand:+ start:2974 stop:3672 length:699 start_codon:yes stop_codon:yes gene_type:complete